MLLNGEKIEYLGNNINVITSKEHHFSTDTILLANFSAPKNRDNVVELGSGCGTIPFLWCKKDTPKNIVAVEIQEIATDMIKRSIALNSLEERVTVINRDLKKLKGHLPFGHFDLVVCNPPYKISGGGMLNPNEKHKIARHEVLCTIDDITKTASSLLRFGGRFCLCQRPERLSDVLESFRKANIEPKKLRFVQQRTTSAPKLFLIEGKKGANKGGLVVLETLLIESGNGEFSQEMIDIYGTFKKDN